MISETEDVRLILDAAIDAIDPGKAVASACALEGDTLEIGGWRGTLSSLDRILVTGAGKAAVPMAGAIADTLPVAPNGGIVITSRGGVPAGSELSGIETVEAAHPVPDEHGVAAARRILDLAAGAGERDLLICLWSGGGSSLLTLPADGLRLEDLRRVTEALLLSGADIAQINAVRKHLSAVKGGLLARAAAPATVCALLISDVVGDRLDTIASGPTAPDGTSFGDALAALERHGLSRKVPRRVWARLRAGRDGEIPPNPSAADPIFSRVHNRIVASNSTATAAAIQAAGSLGLNAVLVSGEMEGEAREVGRRIGRLARETAEGRGPAAPPACLVFGGETTVTVRGGGTGGRNQELALAAAIELNGAEGICVGAFSTDGVDGPTRAAGALVTGDTVRRAARFGMDPAAYLDDNDSNTFFCELRDLIRTGPTYTNVADVVVAVIRPL